MFYSLRLINKLDLIFKDRRGAERAQSANEKKHKNTIFDDKACHFENWTKSNGN